MDLHEDEPIVKKNKEVLSKFERLSSDLDKMITCLLDIRFKLLQDITEVKNENNKNK